MFIDVEGIWLFKCFIADWQYHHIPFQGPPSVPSKVPVLHDQAPWSHQQRFPNYTATFRDWIRTPDQQGRSLTGLITGQRENLWKFSPLPPGRQSQQVPWPKFPFPGTLVFPCEQDLNLFWESTGKLHQISIVQGHPIAASLRSFTCQVTAFIIFTRPAWVLLCWRLPFRLCQYGNKRIFSLWNKKNILAVLQPLIKEN